MSSRLALLVFLVVVVGGGMLIGGLTIPGPWYEALQKPFFNPPNWLFGPAWGVLYVLIAIAGWRVWKAEGFGMLLGVWALQLVVNFLWSPTFFGAQQIGLGLVVVLSMLALILLFIAMAWNRARVAAWLFVPYAAWTAFASLLNAAIFVLN